MIIKQEILQLLADTESHRVERTTSKTDADKFCQAICAYSNDLPDSRKNGYLMIGAYDNGKLSGLKVDDKLLLTISNIRTDGNILPQPLMTVEKFTFEDGDLLVAEIQPSEFPPVRYRGRVWVRVGPRKSVASEAEDKMLTERRLSNVRTFDAKPCLGTSLQDLDVQLIRKEFLPKAVAEDILAEDKRSIEEQLASLECPIQFYEYDDHIEIQNPGGLYGKVNPTNFPNVSDYRNPFIAEAMKVLGYVNRFSRGIYRVQKELKDNGNGEAIFDFSLRTAFRVVENISEKYFEEGFGGMEATKNTQETPKKRPRISKTK